MIIYVEIDGCDDTTTFTLPYSEDMVCHLMTISDKSYQNSSYSCQPRLHFYVFHKEDIFDIDIEVEDIWQHKKKALYHYYKCKKEYNF